MSSIETIREGIASVRPETMQMIMMVDYATQLLKMVEECHLGEDEETLVYELSKMRERAEKVEAQLAAQQPYLRHKSNCDFYHTYANGQDGKCDCGLQAILENKRHLRWCPALLETDPEPCSCGLEDKP